MFKAKISYHLVFVTKYRKKVLTNEILDVIQSVLRRAASEHNFRIVAFGSENMDHIHLVIEARPTQNVSTLVQLMKQYTRYYVWQEYAPYIRQFYWRNNYLWSSGYFCSSLGNVSKDVVLEYVTKQQY